MAEFTGKSIKFMIGDNVVECEGEVAVNIEREVPPKVVNSSIFVSIHSEKHGIIFYQKEFNYDIVEELKDEITITLKRC
jgi:hypothetical protein